MRQAVKILAAIAVLAVPCWLSYANAGLLNPSRELNSDVDRIDVDTHSLVAAAVFSIPRDLNIDTDRISFGTPSLALVAFINFQGKLDVDAGGSGIRTLVPRGDLNIESKRPASANRSSPNTHSPARAASLGLPLGLKANVHRIRFDTPSLAPMAFVRFCLQYSQECEDHQVVADHQPVGLTAERWTELVTINRDVNRTIVPQANENGVLAEEWLLSPETGDCNDYAVTKRHQLLVRGWPSHALLLAEVVIASGEHHLVLVAQTSEGDFVLDNMTAHVRPVSQVRYKWVRAQQVNNPKFWSMISVEKAAQAASIAR